MTQNNEREIEDIIETGPHEWQIDPIHNRDWYSPEYNAIWERKWVRHPKHGL